MSLGLILAGGRSQRFGGEKAAALLGGRTLLARAYDRLADCDAVAVSAQAGSQAQGVAQALGAQVFGDPAGAPRGPLTGVLAGLEWALGRGESLLVVLPCDAPLVPEDLVARLLAGVGDAPAAVARSPGGVQPLCAVWRTSLAPQLREVLALGEHPAVHRVLSDAGAVFVDFPDDRAFVNVNRPQDLAEAERLLSAR